LWPHHDPGGWGSGHWAAAPGLMSATAGSALRRPWLASMEVAGAGHRPHSVGCSAPVPHQGTVAASARPAKVFRSRVFSWLPGAACGSSRPWPHTAARRRHGHPS
jgi:hypothetical protein